MKLPGVFLVFFLISSSPLWGEKRLPVLTDLNQIVEVSSPDLSLDGLWAAYAVETISVEQNTGVSQIWRVSLDGQKNERLTFLNDYYCYLPKWSPDGHWIAFLASSKERGTQLWLIAKNGENAKPLTAINGDISDFTWSPDGKQIAFVATLEPRSSEEGSGPLVITNYQFKTDTSGYLTNQHQHLYRVDLNTQAIDALTFGNHDEYLPAWSPDGEAIAYVTRRGDEPDRSANYDIYLISPKSHAKEKQVTHYSGSDMSPDFDSKLAWSPDSSKIAYLRTGKARWIYYTPTDLAIVDIHTGEEKEVISLDKWVFQPQWSQDGQSIYALIEQNRNTYLYQLQLATGQLRQLTHGLRMDLDYSEKKGKLVVLSTDDTHPAELYALHSEIKQLTHHNQKLLETVAFQPVEDIKYLSSDGQSIAGLLIKPPDFQPGKQYPTLLLLHGGPVDQYQHAFDFESQWYAANGYVVIEPNPRGSSGRGFAFAKAIYADWGNKDVRDVLAGVDFLVNLGIADPKRLAIGGWSYGGILTDYVIAKDSRFKVAVSGAGSANVLSSYGIDQYTLEYEEELGKPWTNTLLYLKLSYPFLNADKITTPTLLLCGQLDFNIPCAGSEQLYQALRSLNIPSMLVIYPDENHNFSYPDNRIDALKRSMDWINKFSQ